MDDITDVPFRRICKDLGADLLYTEFASSEALIRDVESTLRKIRVTDTERPVGVQIFGSATASMEGAAAVAEQAHPDFIDVNCGCWVRKVVLREEGAGLLKDLGKLEAVVKAVIRGTSLPVTVKTRLGWDDDSIIILEAARMLEQAGIHALAVHCRTRNQAFKGKADWSWLEKLKSAVSIPIIGNGDVTTPEDVQRMFETGCDGVMIGRGAIHNPWIFAQTKHFLATGNHLTTPTVPERVALCIEHLEGSIEEIGEPRAILRFRKHYAGYLHDLPHIAKLRAELMKPTELEPIRELLHRYAEAMPNHTHR